MSDPALQPMTSDAFLAWVSETPSPGRFELVHGAVVAMAPERAAHALTKGWLYQRLVASLRAAGLRCEIYPDGMAVRIDDTTVYEPDAMVRCGPPTPPDAIHITDPMIVIEVLSPSTRMVDAGAKLEGYFRLPSVQHYLIVTPGNGAIIHHQRQPNGDILTRISHGAPITLDPPGITLTEPYPPPP